MATIDYQHIVRDVDRFRGGAKNLSPLLLGWLVIGIGLAQAQPRDPFEGAGRERIYFSALDRTKKPVLGLTAKDFGLRVNNWPAEMAEFIPGKPHTDKSIPLIAWILIDFNPKIDARTITNQASAAAGIFALLHPDSAVGVKLVSDRAETLAPLAHDPEALAKAFKDYARKRLELRVGNRGDSDWLGPGGLLRAAELAVDEMSRTISSRPSLQEGEVHRAILLISDGNVNPSYNKRNLFRSASRKNVFLYPIFVPRKPMGSWMERYSRLGKESGGLALIFGALNPGIQRFHLPRENRDANALTFNFLNVIRDLNGKYSFGTPSLPRGKKRVKLKLQCLRKDVSIRLPRRSLP